MTRGPVGEGSLPRSQRPGQREAEGGQRAGDCPEGQGDQLSTWEETPGKEAARCTGQVMVR